MRTKEEIIDELDWRNLDEGTIYTASHMKMAMDEYAKEVALDVLKWFNKTNVSMNLTWANYQLYKQQQEKSSLK